MTEAADQNDQSKTQPGKDNGWRAVVAPFMAILVLIGFTVFIVFMLGQINAEELPWTRAVYLLTGVEAIAFAGAGYLFGTEVNRKRADNAEERASKAEEQAASAQQDAANGKALASVIKAKASTQASKALAFSSAGGEEAAQVASADIDELVDLARQLFP